jgi:hypothetical protein
MDEILAYVKELGDRVYIQSPVGLFTPEPTEIENFAFANEVKKLAPNPHIMWLQGRYVEADRANSNGDQWTAGEIGLKSLTPTLMPITIMHDLRSAVGTIANTALRLPSADADVPRARLETTLALWAHRFPQVADEAKINAEQGTLMQSMECKAPSYECSACGQLYQFMPDRSDKERWCAHLKGEVDASGTKQQGARILRSVVFTGTGLIFGTRGAKGAYSEAHLEVEALAEFHAKARSDSQRQTPSTRRKKSVMEIEDRDYQALVAEKTAAVQKVTTLEGQVAEKDTELEKLEAEKVKAEGERDSEKKRADEAEEKTRVASLRDERLAKLGTGFTAKLAKLETTSKRVHAQAGELSEEDWEARVAELEETLETKRDTAAATDAEDEPQIKKLMGEGKSRSEAEAIVKKSSEERKESAANDDSTAGLLFERGDAARAEVTASAENEHKTPSRESRQSVVAGLVRPRRAPTGAEK